MSDSSVADKIIKQVEYYFGDVNLNKDKFMQEEIQKDSGWIPLETLIKFNRLKSLTTDFQVIIDALKSSTAQLLEIDEENKKVRRAKPLPENLSEFELSLKQNTVYVKGFPSTTLLDELITFFETFGKTLQVFMRRFPSTRQFKGSVFVTFESAEKFKAFMELPEVKYQDIVLIRESQEDYLKRKGPELEKYKNAKQKKDQEKEEKKKQKQEAEEAFYKEQKISGAVLHVKGLNDQATRENLKEVFDTFAKIKWADYNKGEPEAFLRFAEAGKAKEAMEKAAAANNGEITLKGAKLEVRVLEGEEEEKYWKDTIQKLIETKGNKKKQRKRNNNNRPAYKNKNKNKRGHEDGDDDDDDDEGESGGDEENQENGTSAKQNGDAKKLKVEQEAS